MGNKNFDFRYEYILIGSWVRIECLDIYGKIEVLGGYVLIYVVLVVYLVFEIYFVWFL